MRITDQVEMLVSSISRQYLISEPGSVTLIDTGLKGNGKRILQWMQKSILPGERLKYILITHADGDHFGALNKIHLSTHAKTMTSAVEAEAIRAGQSSRLLQPRGFQKILYGLIAPLFTLEAARVDECITNGQILPILGGLQVIATPGHTPGHLSFFAPQSGVLFSGDSIQIRGGEPMPSSGGNTWDQQAANQSFKAQMDLKPKFICGGHGFLQFPQ